MSFHEKSAWACLVSVVLVFVPYFAHVLKYPASFVALFALAVVILVALLTGVHVVNALMTPSIRATGNTPPHDELDRLIELKASKWSGMVLGATVLLWSMVALLGAPAVGVSQIAIADDAGTVVTPSHFAVPVTYALTAIHLLFAGFVIANVTYYGSIIAGYRRLADD